MKDISLIVAIAEDNAIGKNNQLLCHVPGDLKRFKELTTGHTIVMGRLTYESLPNRPLPNRVNIVMSSNKDIELEGCLVAHSIEEALGKCPFNDESFVIGGATIYRQFLPFVNKLYITSIHNRFEADSFFPEIDLEQWKETLRQDFPVSDKNNFGFSFINYERK